MSKRSWTLAALAALLIAAGTGAAYAIPSLGGPTGIVTVPNAAVAPQGSLDTALSYQKAQVAAAGMYQPEDLTAWSLQVLTGVTEQAELWAAYSSVRNGEDSHLWGLGGKVQLTREPEEQTSLAVGASYQKWADAVTVQSAGTSEGDANLTKVYIVATKDFTPLKGETWEWGPGAGTRMLGSLGLMYINADTDMPGSGDGSLTRPFLGFEFVGAGGTTLGLEYRWKDSDLDTKAVFSAVLRHKFSPEFTAEVGTTNADPGGFGLDDQDILVRLGYTIPLKAVY
jgi:hypothetical protein